MRDGFGQLNLMRRDVYVYLIGMTDATDGELRQRAQSFAQPPAIQVQGAEVDGNSYYAQDRQALCLKMNGANRTVEITISPNVRCVNPVFEIKNAPKTLRAVRLNDQEMDTARYRWDGKTLWLDVTLSQPAELQLDFVAANG